MEVTEQQHPDVPDGWAVVAPNTPSAPSAGTWEDRGIGGKVWHPASGATEGHREDNSLLGMPPEFAALSTMAIGRAIGAAGLSAGARALAGLKATAGQVTPVLKYEATKTALTAVGVNPGLATVVATIVAGYKKGETAAPVEAEAANPDLARIATKAERPNGPLTVQRPTGATYANPTGAAPAAPVASPPGAPVPPNEPASLPSASLSPAASAPSPPVPVPAGPQAAANTLPDQKALNEAALAVRRQAYQQRLKASQVAAEAAPVAAPAAAEAAGYVKPAPLTKEETVAFWDYIKRGMSGADAMKNVQLQRELTTTLGTPTPTAAQTRFPKGIRGKVTPKPPVPEPAPVSTPTDHPPGFPGGYEGFRGHVNALAEQGEARVRAGLNATTVTVGGRDYEIPQRWLQGRAGTLETQGLSPKDAYQQSVQDWVDQTRMADEAARKTTPR